jgi:hypothetical protein
VLTESFRGFYRSVEFRTFRDFLDPADMLAAARVATKNSISGDRMLMALEEQNIAQWYEWQTIVTTFSGEPPPVHDPWADSSDSWRRWLLDDRTVAATRVYLQLCSYAEGDSLRTDWDRLTERFYNDKRVGMILVWPDAIPAEARRGDFLYSSPPTIHPPEECWMLCIPKNRPQSRMDQRVVEVLLTRFLTDAAQLKYQESGGITTHRRILDSLDLWARFSFLPALQKVKYRLSGLRSGHASMEPVIKKLTAALEALRTKAHRTIEVEAEGASAVTDQMWYSDTVIAQIQSDIREEFSKVFPMIAAKEGTPDGR